MKLTIVGSRGLNANISKYVPKGITEIISGGAVGIDSAAERYAYTNSVPITVIKPDYDKYERIAPLVRNKKIADISDMVLAVWDGKSRGTKFTIDYAKQIGRPVKIIVINLASDLSYKY